MTASGIKKIIVFTDLDHTLLDLNYSYALAQPSIDALKKHAYPLVMNSSKTYAEQSTLKQALGVNTPFVAENGGVIYWPDGTKEILGMARRQILKILAELRTHSEFVFEGFEDMSVERLAELTGLTLEAAEQAKQREVSEPLLWQGSEVALGDFQIHLGKYGLNLVEGGRFLHVMASHSKGIAVAQIMQVYQVWDGHTQWCSIGLGDSENDISMLKAVDIPVIIPRMDGRTLDKSMLSGAIVAPAFGPEGWNAVISSLVREMRQ